MGPFNLQGGGAMVFFSFRIIFSRTSRDRILIFLLRKAQFFSPEFNTRLYDKNSESDYFFFLHQNQNIFSATLRIGIFFYKINHTPSSFKLNCHSLSILNHRRKKWNTKNNHTVGTIPKSNRKIVETGKMETSSIHIYCPGLVRTSVV